jgi:hypothetical protein
MSGTSELLDMCNASYRLICMYSIRIQRLGVTTEAPINLTMLGWSNLQSTNISSVNARAGEFPWNFQN